jgi:hypothetical protein
MPPLNAHFRFAMLVAPAVGITSHVDSFLLGTAAPDAFDSEDKGDFALYHFQGGDGRISLENFLIKTKFTFHPADNSSWSFVCGYYSHLWLDMFYQDQAWRLKFNKPDSLSPADLRNLIGKEAEILNAPFVLQTGNPSSLSSLPDLFEFVNLARCIQIFHETVQRSHAHLNLIHAFEILNEADYADFFDYAVRSYLSEVFRYL